VTVLHDYPKPSTFIRNSSASTVLAASPSTDDRTAGLENRRSMVVFLKSSTITSGQSNAAAAHARWRQCAPRI